MEVDHPEEENLHKLSSFVLFLEKHGFGMSKYLL